MSLCHLSHTELFILPSTTQGGLFPLIQVIFPFLPNHGKYHLNFLIGNFRFNTEAFSAANPLPCCSVSEAFYRYTFYVPLFLLLWCGFFLLTVGRVLSSIYDSTHPRHHCLAIWVLQTLQALTMFNGERSVASNLRPAEMSVRFCHFPSLSLLGECYIAKLAG